jgi:phage tail-like protein
MRSEVPGLATPYPLAAMVPSFMQEDGFLTRLTAGLDDVLAPAISVLDCLDAYVDPLLAPPDFVTWLAAWVGAPLDENWVEARRRESVLAAATLHRMRGTAEGVRALVSMATGADVEVVEQGHVTFSRTPTDPAAPDPPWLHVRVLTDQPEAIRLAALEELVSAAKPAHVPHTIEVVAR